MKTFVDFSDFDGSLEGQNFDPIPEGEYVVKIEIPEDIEVKKGQNKGTQYISFPVVVEEGEFKGRKIFDNYMLEGAGRWKIGQLLVAAGLMDPAARKQLRLDTKELHGKKICAQVKKVSYTNKDGETVWKNECKSYTKFVKDVAQTTGTFPV